MASGTRPTARAWPSRLLALADRPTAIMCGNDLLALGALQAARIRGLRRPRRRRVTGFNDFEFARFADPPLTTVHVPGYDLGRVGAERLIGRLGGDEPAARRAERDAAGRAPATRVGVTQGEASASLGCVLIARRLARRGCGPAGRYFGLRPRARRDAGAAVGGLLAAVRVTVNLLISLATRISVAWRLRHAVDRRRALHARAAVPFRGSGSDRGRSGRSTSTT